MRYQKRSESYTASLGKTPFIWSKPEPRQPPASRRQLNCFTCNVTWNYSNSSPVGNVPSPLLTLVTEVARITATVTCCLQPCGWVNDHLYCIMSASFQSTWLFPPSPLCCWLRQFVQGVSSTVLAFIPHQAKRYGVGLPAEQANIEHPELAKFV